VGRYRAVNISADGIRVENRKEQINEMVGRCTIRCSDINSD
jgi:hypothetical protein